MSAATCRSLLRPSSAASPSFGRRPIGRALRLRATLRADVCSHLSCTSATLTRARTSRALEGVAGVGGHTNRRGDSVRPSAVADPFKRPPDDDAPQDADAAALEMRLGRVAMLGFFFTTLGDVLTRGEGPLEQLRDEERYVLNHVNPVNVLTSALEVAGVYVEGVVILWVCLAAVFLAAVQRGLASPTRTYSSKKRSAEANAAGAAKVDAVLAGLKRAVGEVVTEQRPYELFNGRLAMVGIAAAFAGDLASGGLGPLEQVSSKTGVPVIDEELFGAFFLFGVVFNVVATGATVAKRAWAQGSSTE